jgi:hypothetical protein
VQGLEFLSVSEGRMNDRKPPHDVAPWATRPARDLIAEAEAWRVEVLELLEGRSLNPLLVECRLGDAGYVLRVTDTGTLRTADYAVSTPATIIASDFLPPAGRKPHR